MIAAEGTCGVHQCNGDIVETDVIMRSVQEEIATYEEASKVVFDISFAINL